MKFHHNHIESPCWRRRGAHSFLAVYSAWRDRIMSRNFSMFNRRPQITKILMASLTSRQYASPQLVEVENSSQWEPVEAKETLVEVEEGADSQLNSTSILRPLLETSLKASAIPGSKSAEPEDAREAITNQNHNDVIDVTKWDITPSFVLTLLIRDIDHPIMEGATDQEVVVQIPLEVSRKSDFRDQE